MKELKPCPFCGAGAVSYTSYGKYGVECFNEKCIADNIETLYHTEEQAAAAWNTRTKEKEQI
jgi:hypothetical protein